MPQNGKRCEFVLCPSCLDKYVLVTVTDEPTVWFQCNECGESGRL